MDDDQNLVERCRAGHEEAVRELIERFQAPIYGVCLRMLGDAHEAEDVAQETFVRAIRSLATWDGRPLRPWLLAIAANRCRTWLARRRHRPLEARELKELTARQTVGETYRELEQEIQTALALLREDYRRVFLLFHEQGCSYDEISDLVDKPIGTIKTWLHRARQQMLDHLRSKGLAPEARRDLTGV